MPRLVIGAIGVLAFLVGGRAIVAGEMTVGDLLRYIMFTAYLTMPIFQLASIGTQITEAFAGLDRIREILDVAREDADAARIDRARRHSRRGRRSGTSGSNTTRACRCIKNVSFKAPAGTHDRARRVVRIGQEHAAQPDHGVQRIRSAARS